MGSIVLVLALHGENLRDALVILFAPEVHKFWLLDFVIAIGVISNNDLFDLCFTINETSEIGTIDLFNVLEILLNLRFDNCTIAV